MTPRNDPPGAVALPSLAGADWLTCTETRVVMAAFAFAGVPARIVGGAVRNALLGRPVKDIDIATPARPEAVIEIARNAGLHCIPTGMDHGTITLIVNHTPFEVTTLRQDVETDGRHASIAYTDDWAVDAGRRDFTINALYCDADGTIHDPLGGYPDIMTRRIRFIGLAADRIREDYLRILRFFRFTAEYAGGICDSDGLEASAALKDGLRLISAERIRSELLRLLEAPGAVRAAAAMDDAGILPLVLGAVPHIARLARLSEIETLLSRPPDALLRLGSVMLGRPGAAQELRDRLRLSSAEYERLARMALPERGYDAATPEAEARAVLYRYGPDSFRDGAAYSWAAGTRATTDPAMRERYSLPDRWSPPVMPVRGQDLLDLGVRPGPEVGRILRDFEDWWILEGFPSDANLLARKLTELVKVSRS